MKNQTQFNNEDENLLKNEKNIHSEYDEKNEKTMKEILLRDKKDENKEDIIKSKTVDCLNNESPSDHSLKAEINENRKVQNTETTIAFYTNISPSVANFQTPNQIEPSLTTITAITTTTAQNDMKQKEEHEKREDIKKEISKDEIVVTEQIEKQEKNSYSKDELSKKKQQSVFPHSTKMEPSNVNDNYDSIYRELYTELLHENNELRQQIKNLKSVIYKQSQIINKEKSVEKLEEKTVEKLEKKIEAKVSPQLDPENFELEALTNNKSFLTFFQKKKKTFSFSNKKKDLTNQTNSTEKNDCKKKKKNTADKKSIQTNKNNLKKNHSIHDDSCAFQNVDNKIDTLKTQQNNNQLGLHKNKTKFTFKEKIIFSPTTKKNKKSIPHLKYLKHFKVLNYPNKMENEYKLVEMSSQSIDNIPVESNFWKDKMFPLIQKKEKNQIAKHYIIHNAVPYEIKNEFWKLTIGNKLQITKNNIEHLYEKTKRVEQYIYNYNEQFQKFVIRNFKSLSNLHDVNNSEYTNNEEEVTDDNQPTNTNDVHEKQNETTIKEKEINPDIDAANAGHAGTGDNEISIVDDNYFSEKENNQTSEETNKKEEKYIVEQQNVIDINTYKHLIENCSVDKAFYQILIDVNRTLYIINVNKEYLKERNISRFSYLFDINVNKLKRDIIRILQMFVLFNPKIGYVQGMSYIAVVFLLYCDIDSAFVHFSNFMERKDVTDMYTFKSMEINFYSYSIKKLLMKRDITIFKKIIKQYNIDNIFVQWIFTFFLICLPFNFFIRLFDIYTFYEKVVFETVVCIFLYFDKFFNSQSIDELVKKLTHFSFNTSINEKEFWKLFKTVKIKESSLSRYRKAFFAKHNRQEKLNKISQSENGCLE